MSQTTRLSAYASIATTAAFGATMGTQAIADTIVYDVGVTYGGTWNPITSSGGPSSASAIFTGGLLSMEPLGAQMKFAGYGIRKMSGSSAGQIMGWALGSGTKTTGASKSADPGRLQVAFTTNKKAGFGKSSGKNQHVRGFESGEVVDSAAKFLPGGKAGAEVDVPGISFDKGLEEGRHFIGFRVVQDWDAEDLVFNYGWVDLSFDYDAGTLTVHRWAYETDADTAASIPGSVVPGPTGILALALGAAGIRRRRERVA